MLIITSNNYCEGINVNSSLMDFYLEDPASYTFTMEVVVNCCEEFPPITIDTTNFDVVNRVYTLTPEQLSTSWETFKDGIYQIKLIVVNNETGSTETDLSCIFVDCTISCEVTNYLVYNPTAPIEEIVSLHTALKYFSECDCACDKGCELFKRLIRLLGVTIDIPKPADCGCKS